MYLAYRGTRQKWSHSIWCHQCCCKKKKQVFSKYIAIVGSLPEIYANGDGYHSKVTKISHQFQRRQMSQLPNLAMLRGNIWLMSPQSQQVQLLCLTIIVHCAHMIGSIQIQRNKHLWNHWSSRWYMWCSKGSHTSVTSHNWTSWLCGQRSEIPCLM